MVTLKCKMCGGDLEIIEESSVCECEYCGSKQTIPSVDDEKKIKLFERANRLRSGCEFDKAAGVYESIIEDFPEEAEAYWGSVLCRYGIEYVDDPATGKKIPTCHRSSFDSIMDDSDFEMVMENCDSISRPVYREEAKYIEEVRKGIIEVSGKEDPYDIFICYKESDENGERTLDSVLAQDVYEALTQKGYRVFFSRISLEDKLGVEYEPYIFAALNSAQIMLAFGSSYEYFNAVWVKNEWSRYLKLMAKDKSKYLIPCFKNVDAYDIPKEFAKLQAQDMGKVGAIQDLLRGIEKILNPAPVSSTPAVDVGAMSETGAQSVALLKRGRMALEDGEWDKATDFFEKVLDRNAENGWAYWGELLAQHKCSNEELLQKKLIEILLESDINIVNKEANSDLSEEYLQKYICLKVLSEEQIKKIFKIFTYDSKVEAFKTIIENNQKNFVLSENKNYQRACQYSDFELRKIIDKTINGYGVYLNDEYIKVKEEEKNNCEDAEKKSKEYYAELDEVLKEIEQVAQKNIEENEKRYQEDLAKWNEEKENLDNEILEYKKNLELWHQQREEAQKVREKMEEYSKQKKSYITEISNLENSLRETESMLLQKEMTKKILLLKNKLNNLEIPEIPFVKSCPTKPVLREKPELSFEDKIDKNGIVFLIASKYKEILISSNDISPQGEESLETFSFEMKVGNIYKIPGRGIAVTGEIEKGEVSLRDQILIVNNEKKKNESTIKGIEKGRQKLMSAKKGDIVGIYLDVNEGDIEVGDRIVKL